MRRTLLSAVAIAILLITVFAALAADGDVTRFGNSTAITATIGGSNGTLNYTGVGFGKSLNVSGDVCIIGGTCLSTVSAGGGSGGGGWLNSTRTVWLSSNSTNVSIGNSTGNGANLFIDNTNNKVGVGTNFPTDFFDVHGNMDLNLSANGIFEIYNVTNSALFNVNGTSGRVGIGTTSPIVLLDVRGAGNFTGLLSAQEFSGPINESFIRNTPTNCTGDNFFQIGEAGGLRFCSTINTSALNHNSFNGTLNVTGGGTGLKTYTTGDLLTGNSTGGLDVIAASTSGQVLTSNGAATKPTWQAAAGGAVTLLRNITFANSNASKYIITQGDVAATCNTYHICLNIYQNSSNVQGSLGIRVNDISTGAYKANRLAYSTLANPSTETAWMFQAQSTGSQDFFGCVDVSRQLNAQGDLLLAGTITGSDQIVFWGGRNAASGALANATLGVYNTSGQANTNLTGTAEVYCMRNQ